MVSNLYQNVDAKTATLRVIMGGALIADVLSAEWAFTFQRPPTANIRVRNPAPGAAVFGAAVTIDAGWNGLTARCFTGTVLNVNADETGVTIECQGKSAVLENTFHKVTVSVDGSKTASQLVEELLAASGLTDYSVNLPAWTPGTVCPEDLEFQSYSEAITKIAEVDGGLWWELPTGTVRVEAIDPVPSATAWRVYFSGVLTALVESYPPGVASGRPRLRHIGQTQQTRDVKNQAWVRGCTYTQTNPDGTEVSIDVEGTALAGSPWVRMPDGSQGYNDLLFSNELIDTPVKAGTVAARLVTLYNRLLTQITAEVDGDPKVALGVTIGLEDPAYSRTTGNWFVGDYRTRIDSMQFVTDFTTLYGGPGSGFTVNICPFALFTYFTDLQVMGSQVWAIVTFDACGSVDPDGSIVLYSWTDNQTPHKVSGSGTDCIFTQRVDPTGITGTWQVTLTVTDNGTPPCSDDITLPVSVDEGTGIVQVPALFVAFDAWFSASPDGGVTWNDQAAPAGWGVVAVGCKPPDGEHYGYGVYGLSGTTAAAGRLYRTTDYCATAPTCVLSGVDSPFEHVWWDLNHPTDCWALAWDGELWRSQDDGAAGSWLVYKDLNTLPWLVPTKGEHVHGSRIATPAPEGVWVFGGQNIDWGAGLVGWPLICWDANLDGNWAQAQVGGELLGDLGAGGPTDLYVKEAASREADELAILFNSATWLTGVYYTPNVLGSGAGWKRASGLPAKSRGRWIAPDFAVGKFAFAYNDAVIYRGDVDPVTNRMAVTVAPAHLDTGPSGTDEPNHGLWIGAFNWWMPGVYLVAAQGPNYPGLVYKSWDRFATIGKLRPATGFEAAHAASKGKMIALSAATQTPAGGVSHPYMLIRDGSTGVDRRLVRLVDGAWETVNAAMPANNWGLRYWGGGHMTHLVSDGLPRYSDDYGVIWSISTAPTGVLYGPYIRCLGIDATPGSTRLWSIWRDNSSCTPSASRHYCIAYSDDWGATWVLSFEENLHDNILNYFRTYYAIACHPSDPNKIFTVGRNLFDAAGRVTTNGGAIWTAWGGVPSNTNVTCHPSVAAPAQLAIWSVGGRMLITSNIGDDVSWSDDLGTTWTNYDLTSIATTQNPQEFCRAGPVGPIYLCYNSANGSTYPESPIFRTLDEGTSWEMVGVPVGWTLAQGAQVGIAYDPYNNWLWFPMRRSVCIYSFDDIYAGGEDDWSDREYNLTSDLGMMYPHVLGVAVVWD
jgi:hypothetical protein